MFLMTQSSDLTCNGSASGLLTERLPAAHLKKTQITLLLTFTMNWFMCELITCNSIKWCPTCHLLCQLCVWFESSLLWRPLVGNIWPLKDTLNQKSIRNWIGDNQRSYLELRSLGINISNCLNLPESAKKQPKVKCSVSEPTLFCWIRVKRSR